MNIKKWYNKNIQSLKQKAEIKKNLIENTTIKIKEEYKFIKNVKHNWINYNFGNIISKDNPEFNNLKKYVIKLGK